MQTISDSNSGAVARADKVSAAIKSSQGTSGIPLSDAALRYVAALYDPRACFEQAWVPTQVNLSQKTKVFSRGAFSSGTTGFGFVTANPTGANDVNVVANSTATTVQLASTLLNAATNQGTARHNGPYASAQIGSTAGLLNWRIVGAALYVRWAGTELNRGGDMLLFEEPNHGAASLYSYNTSMNVDGVKRVPMDGDWHHVCWTPNTNADSNWLSTASINSGNDTLAVIVNAATGTAQPFEYEYYAWYEYVGTVARSLSASYEDIIGYSIVQAAGNMYEQLDSDLGLHGFMAAIQAQAMQCSGAKVAGAPSGNWAGLLAFLPALASLVGPPLLKAATQGMRAAFRSLGGGGGNQNNNRQRIPRPPAAMSLPKQGPILRTRVLKALPKKKV